MLPHRSLARAAATAAALLVLTACGGGDDGSDDGGDDGGSAAADQPGEQAGEQAGEVQPFDACATVTAEQMGEALGTDGLVVSQIPGGGCDFSDEDDPRQPSVSLAEVPVDEANGGFAGFSSGVAGALGGEAETLDGVGDEAFVVTGTVGGGSSVTGGGGVRRGDVAVQVTLLQSDGLPADDVRGLVVEVLNLVAAP